MTFHDDFEPYTCKPPRHQPEWPDNDNEQPGGIADFVNRHMLASLIVFAILIIGGGSFMDGYFDAMDEIQAAKGAYRP